MAEKPEEIRADTLDIRCCPRLTRVTLHSALTHPAGMLWVLSWLATPRVPISIFSTEGISMSPLGFMVSVCEMTKLSVPPWPSGGVTVLREHRCSRGRGPKSASEASSGRGPVWGWKIALLVPFLQHQALCGWKDPGEDNEDPTRLGTRGHKNRHPLVSPEALMDSAG